jgi:hypothetical protein
MVFWLCLAADLTFSQSAFIESIAHAMPWLDFLIYVTCPATRAYDVERSAETT